MNQSPLNPQPLSTYVYAPTNVAFMHTSSNQFTHFSESKSGNRTTFGLSCEQLLALANPAVEKFSQPHRKLADKVIIEYVNELSILSNTLARMVEDFKRGSSLGERAKSLFGRQEGPPPSYSTDHEAAKAVVDSGHIPIMLSAILSAADYGRAARSVSADDVEFYFGKMLGARNQCREYLVKQDMMKAIAAFRTKVNFHRCSLPAGEVLSFCNNLVTMLDEEIINPNRKSLPENCETFDLYDTFISKLYDLWCQMPNRPEYSLSFDRLNPNSFKFFNSLKEALHSMPNSGYSTYHYQQSVSNAVYVGLNEDSAGVELKAEQDNHLRAVLPMIEYMNSEFNPFARDGLFGEVVTNDFHNISLRAYAEHESKMKPKSNQSYEYVSKASSHPKFTNDQLAKLLFGSDEAAEEDEIDTKKKGASAVGFFGRLMLEGSTSQQKISDSENRSQMLALPMPARYDGKLLTHVPQAPAPAPSAPAVASKAPAAAAPNAAVAKSSPAYFAPPKNSPAPLIPPYSSTSSAPTPNKP
jgi:hypothetical protein